MNFDDKKTTEYRSFVIWHFKGSKRIYYKIYQDGIFKQTCDRIKDAKRLVDWCIEHKVWEEK